MPPSRTARFSSACQQTNPQMPDRVEELNEKSDEETRNETVALVWDGGRLLVSAHCGFLLGSGLSVLSA